MDYYDDEKNVDHYEAMAEGYDGALLVEALRQHLAAGSSVLELGMGPGKDYLLLSEHYTVTGSDRSTIFVERFRERHPDADLMLLNVVTMDTNRRFDAIYSNKVLYHLTREQLERSLGRQRHILRPGGLALHAFWYGEGAESMHGLHFVYYTEEQLQAMAKPDYEVVKAARYTEMEADDSFYILLKNSH